MYGKIHDSIYDSSIAEDPEVRWIFQDMCILSDEEGILDMTAAAFARRINVPLEKVERAINNLLQPDPSSRTAKDDGRRIKLIEPDRRDWGWIVINKPEYRMLASKEDRLIKNRIRKERYKIRKQMRSEGKTTEEIENAISLFNQSLDARGTLGNASEPKERHTDTNTIYKSYNKPITEKEYKKTCETCQKPFIALEHFYTRCPQCFKNSKGDPLAQPPPLKSKFIKCPYCNAEQTGLRVDHKLKGCNACKPEEVD